MNPVDRAVRIILTVAHFICWYSVARALFITNDLDSENNHSGMRNTRGGMSESGGSREQGGLGTGGRSGTRMSSIEIVHSERLIKADGHTIDVGVTAAVKKRRN